MCLKLKFSGKFGLVLMLGPGLLVALQRCGAFNFNFYFLFFLSSEQENFSVNQYFHGSQVIATGHLFIAGSELSCLQIAFLLPSPHLP